MVSSDPTTLNPEEARRLPGGGVSLKPPKLSFRPDIEGLRALAIAAVLLYHADFRWAPGGYVGVDMFFVISGFLITRLLVYEVEDTGTVSLRKFYGRRAKRLLPATAVLLTAVVVLAAFVYSPLDQERTAWDVVASGAYVINWRLAAGAVDYFAAGLQASPLQHFWSLAVEEQFYIVWPALLLTATTLSRRGRAPAPQKARIRVGTVLAVLAAASFLYGLHLTQAEAGAAYFSTFTRGWEFCIGAGLALIRTSTIRFRVAPATLLAWGGLAAVVWSVTNLNDITPFPGTAALVPTLGTAAIILAGFSEKPVPAVRALGRGFMRHLGRLSYSWYLWHWPLLVFAAAAWGELSGATKLAVAAASYFPALLTHLWVERPVHHHPSLQRSPAKALLVGAGCTAASVCLGLVLVTQISEVPTAPLAESRGAARVRANEVPEQKDAPKGLRPPPQDAYDDVGPLRDEGCQATFKESHPKGCVYGHKGSDTTVAVLGDSLVGMYFPALQRLADDNEWRLIGLTKNACPPPRYTRFLASLKRAYDECDTWRDRAIEGMQEEEPEMIIVGGQPAPPAMEDGEKVDGERSAAIAEEGWVETFKLLKATGSKVVLIRSGPHPPEDMPECISSNEDDLTKCAFSRDEAFDYAPADVRAARRVSGVTILNPTPMLCNVNRCPAVIGNVLVYRQGVHITATYAETLTPWFEERLPKV